MGIPRFFRWLTSTFPDAFSTRTEIEADHIYVDLNEVLHYVLGLLGSQPEEAVFFAALYRRLDKLLEQVVPKSGGSIFFAVDGPAATAKISEQRRRRRERVLGDKLAKGRIATNMLTPGVPFMAVLSAALEEYCQARLGFSSNLAPAAMAGAPRWPEGVRATVSGAGCPGEGEHKIFTVISRAMTSGSDQEGAASKLHVVLGKDSDLFLLPLGIRTMSSKILVVSPAVVNLQVFDAEVLAQCIGRQRRKFGGACGGDAADAAVEEAFGEVGEEGNELDGKTKAQLKQICSNAGMPTNGSATDLRNRVMDHRKPSAGAANTLVTSSLPILDEEMNLRRDFVVVTLFRGNDYIPQLVSAHDPGDLWPRYLLWRRASSPGTGLLGPEEGLGSPASDVCNLSDGAETSGMAPVCERLAFRQAALGDFMAFIAASAGAPAADAEADHGVSTYLCGLMWCVETYANGYCSNYHFRFPGSLKRFASAALIAKRAPSLVLEYCRGNAPPLAPLACAVALLPIADARALLLPKAPCLAPLLQKGAGLLAEVVRLETCSECKLLMAAAASAPAGNTAAKRRKALEIHRSGHSDIDSVQLVELEAEVRRLCAASEEASSLAQWLRLSSEVMFGPAHSPPDLLQAPAKRPFSDTTEPGSGTAGRARNKQRK